MVDSGATKRREGKLVELHEENNDGVWLWFMVFFEFFLAGVNCGLL